MARTELSTNEAYINSLFGLEDSHLKRIREAAMASGKGAMEIGPYEGRLLQVLVGLVGARKVVEIGTFFGYSALWMARALPADGHLWTFEFSPEHHAQATEFLKSSDVAGRVSLIQGDACEMLSTIEREGPFDVVFIDANKSAYGDYLAWAEKNVRKGGLIIGDNVFLFGHVTGGEIRDRNMSPKTVDVLKNFNRRLADTSQFRGVIIPTFEGLAIAQKV